jgi:hypothetical protein
VSTVEPERDTEVLRRPHDARADAELMRVRCGDPGTGCESDIVK